MGGEIESKSYMTHLECSYCYHHEDCDQIINCCSKCNHPLLAKYDLEKVKQFVTKQMISMREPSLWKYRELLPLRNTSYCVSMGEGMSPLWKMKSMQSIWVKDESQMPTGTFKSRGASVALSRAKELGISTVCLPSNGNAGGAWASYGARGNVNVVLAIPKDATCMAKEEAILYGATVYLVDGLINDCGKIISQYVNDFNHNSTNATNNKRCFDVSTLKEPYRVEGKKTMGFEIAEQFGWQLPDAIVYPTGGGVGIIAIYKAFQELIDLGWVNSPMPKFISVQSSGCQPLKLANDKGKSKCEIYENAKTIAVGMRVPKSFGDFLILDICNKTNGGFIIVDDEEILKMYKEIPKREGAFLCLEGAAAMAGLEKAMESSLLSPSDRVVVINTGSGLKTPNVLPSINIPILCKDGKIEIN